MQNAGKSVVHWLNGRCQKGVSPGCRSNLIPIRKFLVTHRSKSERHIYYLVISTRVFPPPFCLYPTLSSICCQSLPVFEVIRNIRYWIQAQPCVLTSYLGTTLLTPTPWQKAHQCLVQQCLEMRVQQQKR